MTNHDFSKNCLKYPDDYKNIELHMNKAVTFLEDECGLNFPDYEFHYIITENYLNDLEKYLLRFNEKNYKNSNGTYQHPSELKESNNKPFIFFNWKKLSNTPDNFIISVYIHELVHFLDHHLCPKIEEKYGAIWVPDGKSSETDKLITNMFNLWSEKRAKYYQEKYICSSPNKKNMIKHIQNTAKKITNGDDSEIFYNYAHLLGQILCWEQLYKTSPPIAVEIKKQKDICKDFLKKCGYMTFFSEDDLFDTLNGILVQKNPQK